MLRVKPREFRLLQAMIQREAGIYLSEVKEALVAARLSRRLRVLGMRSFGDYCNFVSGPAGRQERSLMVEAVCTHETHFFREPQHFMFLEGQVYPEWRRLAASRRRPRRISVWSAACSTGEEPYSLAMHLLGNFPADAGWSIDVVATDLSRPVLERAEAGVWPVQRSEEIPAPYLKRFMLRGTGAETGRMKASDELRAVIRFGRVNLSSTSYSVGGRFDLIFCRNVLIYFGASSRREVIQRLVGQHLDPAGYLFLGHAETVHGFADRLRSVGPTIYASTLAGAAGGEG